MQANQPLNRRTSHIQLPTSDEMSRIAAVEARRPHAPGKDGVRYVKFDAIESICDHWQVDKSLFQLTDKASAEILKEGEEVLRSLIEAILTHELDDESTRLLGRAYDYLSEEDNPKASDLIFVFGARTPLRIVKAIELFKQGLAPQILMSGRGPLYDGPRHKTEARRYAEAAIEAGIPEDVLIVEEASITLVDNIRRSLNVLDEMGKKLDSLIIVNSPYTQRRGWCMWRKYVTDEVQLYRVNCETGPKFTAENWYRNEDGLRVVLGEFIKLRNAVAFDSV